MSKVIAISAWKGSGKDAAASILLQNNYLRVAFADILKDLVAEEYNIPRKSLDDQNQKEAPLLHLPVKPKDKFTRMVCEFMVKEFRSRDGQIPLTFSYDADDFVGEFGRHAEDLYWTPRALAILKGSGNRAVRSDFWLSKAIDIICINPHLNFVITDLRYKNEINGLREAFGDNLVTVRINRFETCASQDPSEHDLDDAKFDVIIDNKGTLEEFYEKVRGLL